MRSEKGVAVATPQSNIDSSSALSSWLLGWFAEAGVDDQAAIVQACYGLWMARNKAKDGQKIAAPHEIMASVCAYMSEWSTVHRREAPERKTKEACKWTAPEEGWIKANSDGAVSKHGQKGGGGVILRGHAGDFRAAACHFYQHESEPEMVEILACKRVVELAAEINVRKLHLERDNKAVALMLQKEEKNLTAAGPRVEEIKSMFQSFDDVKVSWVGRSANSAAHKLARVGVGEELCKVWLIVPPDFVLSVVSDGIPDLF